MSKSRLYSSEYSGLISFRIDWFYLLAIQGTAVALVVKKLPANAGELRDKGLIPGSGRSLGGGHGNPLQYYCLENSMNRGAWWATVHGVAKGRSRLKQFNAHARELSKF